MKITLSSLITVVVFFLNFSTASAANVDFTPRISVSEEYTDNLDLDASNEKEDFITTITPGFTLDIDARSSGLILSYDAGYSFYDEYDEYDSWRHSASLTGWTEISRRSRLEVTDTGFCTRKTRGTMMMKKSGILPFARGGTPTTPIPPQLPFCISLVRPIPWNSGMHTAFWKMRIKPRRTIQGIPRRQT